MENVALQPEPSSGWDVKIRKTHPVPFHTTFLPPHEPHGSGTVLHFFRLSRRGDCKEGDVACRQLRFSSFLSINFMIMLSE